jgi:hypothetical protein
MNRFRIYLIGLILTTLSFQARAEWQLDAKPIREGDSTWSLEFTLKNRGHNTVKTFASSLPWGIQVETILTAVPLVDNANALEQTHFISDPMFDPIEIKPGETLKGKIRLSRRFPGLNSYVAKGPVAVCFLYKFDGLQQGNVDSASGCLLLKSGKSQ